MQQMHAKFRSSSHNFFFLIRGIAVWCSTFEMTLPSRQKLCIHLQLCTCEIKFYFTANIISPLIVLSSLLNEKWKFNFVHFISFLWQAHFQVLFWLTLIYSFAWWFIKNQLRKWMINVIMLLLDITNHRELLFIWIYSYCRLFGSLLSIIQSFWWFYGLCGKKCLRDLQVIWSYTFCYWFFEGLDNKFVEKS